MNRKQKTYPFNMDRFGEDIYYKYCEVKSEYYDWDPEYNSASDYEYSKYLCDLMETLAAILEKGPGIVGLTAKEYRIAKETVFWADIERNGTERRIY